MRKFMLFVSMLALFLLVGNTVLGQVVLTADLSVSQTQTINPAIAGSSFDYQITISNEGPDAADSVQLVDILPAGLAYQSDTGNCHESPVGTLICNIGLLGVAENRVITVTVLPASDLVYNAAAPVAIMNQLSVANLNGSDPNLTNNGAVLESQVIAAADLSIVSVAIMNPPSDVFVGENVDITLHTVISNAAVSAPIDASFVSSASSLNGSLVEPLNYQQDVLAIGLNESRSLDTVFTITCNSASETFSFTSAVLPLREGDTDSNPVNNSATVELTLDCIVPVTIDIRPNNSQNTINLNSNGEIQVAILSNPDLDFDATSIDPSTLFLAGAPVILINDSYKTEIQDVDEDGNADLIVYIQTSDLQLNASDTSATLAASTDAGLRVIGSDSLRIVGNGE